MTEEEKDAAKEAAKEAAAVELAKITKEKQAKEENINKDDDDSIKWRAKYKVTKEQMETEKAKADIEKQELSSKVATNEKAKQMYEQKYIDAEIKAYAVAAGIRDIEFVKLIGKDDIKLDESGNVVGVEKAISELKTRKPDWFGSEKKTSSSSNASFAEKESKVPVDARSMSQEDWKKNKSKFMSGQF